VSIYKLFFHGCFVELRKSYKEGDYHRRDAIHGVRSDVCGERGRHVLYIATSTRHKNWKEIVAFPQIKPKGKKTLLSFVNDHQLLLSGRIESITETTVVFLVDGTGGEERLTIQALTDQDFDEICLQRRSDKWAVPQSKDELYSWYVG